MHQIPKLSTLRPRQYCCHFADNIFKCIFWNENVWISLKISLKFAPKVWINNIPALVQIIAWDQSGDKPFSEPVMFWLLTRMYITQWTECFSSGLAVFFASIEVRCWVQNEDIVGAAWTGTAPATSEWSTSLLPTKVLLILDVWQNWLIMCH